MDLSVTGPNQAPTVNNEVIDVNTESVDLARAAADGDNHARKQISELIHPIINYQTTRFCKRFCKEHRYLYHCTLDSKWATGAKDKSYCEWGNASYAWMLNDLANEKRLRQFNGSNGARINDYLYRIANSLPFYERWKDWRFGRKIHVPVYIQDISQQASTVFLAIRSGENTALIAQKLQQPEHTITQIAENILIELTTRNKLYLLDPPVTVSLSDTSGSGEPYAGVQNDIPSFDLLPEQTEERNMMNKAWTMLSAVEQFVLEAMLIEEQDANDILSALKKLDIPLKDGVPASSTNRQQLYYFRRKTITKLANLYETISNQQ